MRLSNDSLRIVSDLAVRNARLRNISPVYPQVYTERGSGTWGEEVTMSTWVPYVHEGKSWQRHCVEVLLLGEYRTVQECRERLDAVARFVEKYAIPYPNTIPLLCDRER